ncbi:protein translocase subunit SecF [Gottschalkia purinilytica]|uniref:Protein-export membrane protein SecF n=1 Tax=Gottschalkia purinilytica TaxID=1503 RepID=A0A0L0WCL8_GOTPU|nr:protein translocase subunit SecF [Gottschalkia purinilytica]KNF09224.1 protein translocase subunit SecF [Gottschalkia purinilytica]
MNIVKNRNIFFTLSILFIVVGIFMAAFKGLNYGIDFTGGTLIQIDLEKKVPTEDIRKITNEFDKNASIIHAGENKNQVIIKSSLNLNDKQTKEIFNKFKEKYNLKATEADKAESLGSAIGSEIQRNALIAVIAASIGILLYVTFRFEFKFGLSAVISLIHDALFMFSFYSIFRLQIDSTFIAAILTIIGYSINDTIVIFDRIRENSKNTKKENYEELINNSIKQTLRRTMATSFTTLISIMLLYIIGVEAIKGFALPLVVGIIIGTYSSIFIASPIWYILKTRTNSNKNLKQA